MNVNLQLKIKINEKKTLKRSRMPGTKFRTITLNYIYFKAN